MHIVFVTVDYPPGAVGGAEHQAALQARELVRRGHVVDVLCPRWRDRGSEVRDGVRITRVRYLDRTGWIGWTIAAGLFVRLAWLARSATVIHVHLAGPYADVAVVVGRLMRVPVYVKVAAGGASGEVARRRVRTKAGRWLGLRWASCVQALSDEIEAELIDAGVNRRRIVRIPNGVDRTRFSPCGADERRIARERLGIAESTVVFIYSGRFARYKGAAEAVEAWKLAGLAEALLLMAGTYTTEDAIDPIGQIANLRVLQWLERPEELLRAADVYVHPAHGDGMSNALLEAQSCGLPVIAASSGAARGYFADRDALLYEVGNAPALADAMVMLEECACERRRLAARSLDLVEPLTIHHVVAAIEAEYLRLAGNRPSSSRSCR